MTRFDGIGLDKPVDVRGQLGSSHRLPVSEYTPSQVKVAVAGSGRASKADIQKMIPLLLKIPEKSRLDDELDAIAIGITHLACTRV
jgi:crossover junction endodeoxyribonuclease RuvC